MLFDIFVRDLTIIFNRALFFKEVIYSAKLELVQSRAIFMEVPVLPHHQTWLKQEEVGNREG